MIINHFLAQIVLFAWAVAVMFHLANGIRYLFWDGPKIGFDPNIASLISIVNFGFSVVAAGAIYAYAVIAT